MSFQYPRDDVWDEYGSQPTSTQINYEINEATKKETVPQEAWELFLQSLAPFAPYASEELWSQLGHKDSIHMSSWKEIDESLLEEDIVEIAIQVNGKTRHTIEVTTGAKEEEVIAKAQGESRIQAFLEGKELRKVIYIPGRIINFVV